MITIFNRKELIKTYDLKEQAKVRNLLSDYNIKYSIKTFNRNSPTPFAAGTRASMGTLGEKLSLQCEYTIYVHKDNYSEASSIVMRSV